MDAGLFLIIFLWLTVLFGFVMYQAVKMSRPKKKTKATGLYEKYHRKPEN